MEEGPRSETALDETADVAPLSQSVETASQLLLQVECSSVPPLSSAPMVESQDYDHARSDTEPESEPHTGLRDLQAVVESPPPPPATTTEPGIPEPSGEQAHPPTRPPRGKAIARRGAAAKRQRTRQPHIIMQSEPLPAQQPMSSLDQPLSPPSPMVLLSPSHDCQVVIERQDEHGFELPSSPPAAAIATAAHDAEHDHEYIQASTIDLPDSCMLEQTPSVVLVPASPCLADSDLLEPNHVHRNNRLDPLAAADGTDGLAEADNDDIDNADAGLHGDVVDSQPQPTPPPSPSGGGGGGANAQESVDTSSSPATGSALDPPRSPSNLHWSPTPPSPSQSLTPLRPARSLNTGYAFLSPLPCTPTSQDSEHHSSSSSSPSVLRAHSDPIPKHRRAGEQTAPSQFARSLVALWSQFNLAQSQKQQHQPALALGRAKGAKGALLGKRTPESSPIKVDYSTWLIPSSKRYKAVATSTLQR